MVIINTKIHLRLRCTFNVAMRLGDMVVCNALEESLELTIIPMGLLSCLVVEVNSRVGGCGFGCG